MMQLPAPMLMVAVAVQGFCCRRRRLSSPSTNKPFGISEPLWILKGLLVMVLPLVVTTLFVQLVLRMLIVLTLVVLQAPLLHSLACLFAGAVDVVRSTTSGRQTRIPSGVLGQCSLSVSGCRPRYTNSEVRMRIRSEDHDPLLDLPCLSLTKRLSVVFGLLFMSPHAAPTRRRFVSVHLRDSLGPSSVPLASTDPCINGHSLRFPPFAAVDDTFNRTRSARAAQQRAI